MAQMVGCDALGTGRGLGGPFRKRKEEIEKIQVRGGAAFMGDLVLWQRGAQQQQNPNVQEFLARSPRLSAFLPRQ